MLWDGFQGPPAILKGLLGKHPNYAGQAEGLWHYAQLEVEMLKTNLWEPKDDIDIVFLPTTSCTEVATRTIEEHVTSSSNAVVVCPGKKLSQYQL